LARLLQVISYPGWLHHSVETQQSFLSDFSIADGFTLVQLAWSTYEGAKKACGEHGDLTKELSTLCDVLRILQAEEENPDSLIHRARGNHRKELGKHVQECRRHLESMSRILDKYNSLSDEERKRFQLWKRVNFGTGGATKDVSEIRRRIATYTTAISMSLKLISERSQGRMEKMLDRQGGEISGLRESVNLLVASRMSLTPEGSLYTHYSNDDIDWWRTLRRNLVKSGYKSQAIKSRMGLIQEYVKELGDRGMFDGYGNRSNEFLGTMPTADTPDLKVCELEIPDMAMTGVLELSDQRSPRPITGTPKWTLSSITKLRQLCSCTCIGSSNGGDGP
jgi:hypothetical protein